MTTVVRIILTLPLLFFAYRETGPWTVVVLALLVVTIELHDLARHGDE